MPARSRAFGKSERLAKKRDIDAVFASGRSFSRRGMKLLARKKDEGPLRAVFIPVRSYPDAVRRNRARRLASESFRLVKERCDARWDVVFVLFPGTDSFAERERQMVRLLSEAGILRETPCETP